MGRVLKFRPEKEGVESFNESLFQLMKNAQKQEEDLFDGSKKVAPIDFQGFERVVLLKINNVLMENQCCNSDYYHCGSYIAKLFSSFAENPPESFYAIDYMAKIKSEEDYYNFRLAGDMCFFLCSVFPERCNRRMMTYKDYLQIGKTMYANFYNKTEQKIAYLMSSNYEEMAQVTATAINTLSE